MLGILALVGVSVMKMKRELEHEAMIRHMDHIETSKSH